MPVKLSSEPTAPGFFQGLRGRASGRPSPRVPLRAPRREQVFADHGLLESGQADPNQGQLFEPNKVLGPATPQATLSRAGGAAPPLASNEAGFMPELTRADRKGNFGTPAARKATTKAKVNALTKMQDARIRTDTNRGTGAPVAEVMQDRQALYDSGKPADWYQPVSGEGNQARNVPGESKARLAIDNAAARTGTSSAQMTRVAAVASPRTAWDEGGAPGTTSFSMPNLDSAEAVVRNVRSEQAKSPDVPLTQDARTDIGETAQAFAATEYESRAASNQPVNTQAPNVAALQQSMGKAARLLDEPTTNPIPIQDKSSQKVPNFEQSLNLSHVDPNVVKGAAGSYTVDGWDTKGIGGDETLLKSEHGYAIAKMTGVRAALKNRELPGNFQARTWNAIRDQQQPASMRDTRLFQSVRSQPGAYKVNPKAQQGNTDTPGSGDDSTYTPRQKLRGGGFVPDDLTPF